MRILLIQAISTIEGGELVFPLGLARLAASCLARHEVRGLDLNLHPFPWPELVKTLLDFQPEVIGISFRNLDPLGGNHVSFVPQLKTLATLAKKYRPEATLVLGGSGFTLFAERLLAEIPAIDLAVAGEAELIWPLLLDHLKNPAAVPGIWHRAAAGPSCPGAILHCQELDTLPWPAWQVFHPSLYLERNRYVAFMGVETKRGCSNRCRYCLYPVLQGRRVRLRQPARVVDEIAWLQQEYGINYFHFTDAVVNQPAAHLRAICTEIKKRRLHIGWTGFFREDCLTAADLELYQQTGLMTLYFSGDGASDHALQLLGKDLTRQHLLTAARLAAASGILTVYHFLVNLPGESESSVAQLQELLTALFAIHAPAANLGAVVLNNLRLYPHAPLTADIIQQGLIDPRQDLLYPTYFNPPPWDYLRHELSSWCMYQGALSWLENKVLSGTTKDAYADCPT